MGSAIYLDWFDWMGWLVGRLVGGFSLLTGLVSLDGLVGLIGLVWLFIRVDWLNNY